MDDSRRHNMEPNKPDTKSTYHKIPCIEIQEWAKSEIVTEIRTVVIFGKGHEGSFWGAGNSLYLSWDGWCIQGSMYM